MIDTYIASTSVVCFAVDTSQGSKHIDTQLSNAKLEFYVCVGVTMVGTTDVEVTELILNLLRLLRLKLRQT